MAATGVVECERCAHSIVFEILDRISGRVTWLCACCLLQWAIEIDDKLQRARKAS